MDVFEDGAVIIEQYPHSAFDKVVGCGYTICYHIEQNVESLKELEVKVLYGENVVANANFTDDGRDAWCQNVRVLPAHQKQGIATAIYVFAEKVYGKALYNFWENNPAQTPAARALWAQSNCPFGSPLKGK
jgi:GNAT superfamily N-acetyltransferase